VEGLPKANEEGWIDKGDWKELLREEMERGLPERIEGWELDKEDGERMRTIHPEGEETAMEASSPTLSIPRLLLRFADAEMLSFFDRSTLDRSSAAS
jgi:hypothetical protein